MEVIGTYSSESFNYSKRIKNNHVEKRFKILDNIENQK
jgi:hypothetical protein